MFSWKWWERVVVCWWKQRRREGRKCSPIQGHAPEFNKRIIGPLWTWPRALQHQGLSRLSGCSRRSGCISWHSFGNRYVWMCKVRHDVDYNSSHWCDQSQYFGKFSGWWMWWRRVIDRVKKGVDGSAERGALRCIKAAATAAAADSPGREYRVGRFNNIMEYLVLRCYSCCCC